jgi:DNA helicase-2/ATP-dependent DNA helicase PcrA
MSNTESSDAIEEERRLAYVAITRARQRLFLTYAAMRRAFGNASSNPPSRFVAEIPDQLLELAGVGSAGFAGFGWDKRSDRSGIAGHGLDYAGSSFAARDSSSGRVFGGGQTRGDGPLYGAAVRPKEIVEPLTFESGDLILHKVFGKGTIEAVDGDTLTVAFEGSAKTKTLLAGYAPIVKIT